MKHKYLSRLVLAGAIFGFGLQVNAQNLQEKEQIRSSYDLQKLESLRANFQKKNISEKREASRLAKQNGWKEKVILSEVRIL